MSLLLNTMSVVAFLAMVLAWLQMRDSSGLTCLAIMLCFGAFMASPFISNDRKNADREMESFARWGLCVLSTLSALLICLEFEKQAILMALGAGMFLAVLSSSITDFISGLSRINLQQQARSIAFSMSKQAMREAQLLERRSESTHG